MSVQQSRPSLGKDDEDDEFGLRDLEDALTESLRSKSMKEDDDYNMTGDFGAGLSVVFSDWFCISILLFCVVFRRHQS